MPIFLHTSSTRVAGFGLSQRKSDLFFGVAGLFMMEWPLYSIKERPDTAV